MTQDELELREAIATERHDWETVELVAEVRLLRKALEIAAEQFVAEASGTVEGHVDALLNEAREALEGA